MFDYPLGSGFALMNQREFHVKNLAVQTQVHGSQSFDLIGCSARKRILKPQLFNYVDHSHPPLSVVLKLSRIGHSKYLCEPR